MKKIILILLLLFFVTGCTNTAGSACEYNLEYNNIRHKNLLKDCYNLDKEKNYELMIEMLLDNRKFAEKSPILLSYLGEAYAKEGHVMSAVNTFEKVIKIAPIYPKPYYGLAYIYGYRLEDKTKGIKYFQLFIQQAEMYLNDTVCMKIYSPMYTTGSLKTNMEGNIKKAKKHISKLSGDI